MKWTVSAHTATGGGPVWTIEAATIEEARAIADGMTARYGGYHEEPRPKYPEAAEVLAVEVAEKDTEPDDPRDRPAPVPERTAIDHAEAADLLRGDGLYGAARHELNKGLRKVRTLGDLDALMLTADGFFPLLAKRDVYGQRSELRIIEEYDNRIYYLYLVTGREGSSKPENLWRVAEF